MSMDNELKGTHGCDAGTIILIFSFQTGVSKIDFRDDVI
jgi:hypothetical protein